MDNRAPDLGPRGGCTMQLVPFVILVVVALYATAAAAMGDNVVGQLMDQFQQWLSDKWDAVFDPIYFHYAAWIFGLIAAGFIATFVPFKIVRLSLGLALLIGAAFIYGERHRSIHDKERIDKLRKQLAEAKAERRQGGGGGDGGSSGGGGFFDFFR